MSAKLPTATGLGQQFANHITGKTILITGPSPESIAAQFAIALAPHKPALIILAGRSASKLDETTKQVKQAGDCPTRNLIVDFGDMSSVRKAVAEVNGYSEDIDVAMLSAGVMGPPYSKTSDGFESGFATNHLGPFLFINGIMSKVQAAGRNNDGARIVTVSSDGHAVSGIKKDIESINFNDGKTYNRWHGYGQSKTANALLALSLSDKLAKDNVQAYSLHPGVILSSGIGQHIEPDHWSDFLVQRENFRKTLSHERRAKSTNIHTVLEDIDPVSLGRNVDEGAATLMVAAFDPSIKAQTGGYLQNSKIDNDAAEDHAKSQSEAERLWKISEQCVGQTFAY